MYIITSSFLGLFRVVRVEKTVPILVFGAISINILDFVSEILGSILAFLYEVLDSIPVFLNNGIMHSLTAVFGLINAFLEIVWHLSQIFWLWLDHIDELHNLLAWLPIIH